MSQLPPQLRPTRLDSSTIEYDRPCPFCGYNLRGLRTGDRCPECATPIAPSSPSTDDSLGGAPVEYLRVFARGSVTIGVTALPMLALLCAELWIGPGSRAFTLLAAVNALIAGAWGLGVFMTTTRRPGTPEVARDGSEEWWVLRLITRVTQWAWVCSQVLWLCSNQLILGAGRSTPYSNLFLIFGTLAMLAAAAGLFALLLYLIRIAIWANDTELADRLRLIPLILSVSVVVLVAAGVVGPMLGGGVVTFMLVPITGVSGLFLLYSLWTTIGVSWQLGSLGFWALRNRSTQLESSQRRSARIVARIENGLARPIHRTEPAPQGHKPANPQGNYLPKSNDAPIELLDDKKT